MIRRNSLTDAWQAYRLRGSTHRMKPMRKATLTRFETGPLGTFGDLVTDNGYQCVIVEKPWADNKTDESCILPKPGGKAKYKAEPWESPKFGKCFRLVDVPGRTDILIHPANWARQLLGCLAPGRAIGDVHGFYHDEKVHEKGVMSSRDALWGLEQDVESGPFEITIQWSPEFKS